MRSTLLDLKLAIEGTIIMSESLRDALDCMYDARIPAKWLKVSRITVTQMYCPVDKSFLSFTTGHRCVQIWLAPKLITLKGVFKD